MVPHLTSILSDLSLNKGILWTDGELLPIYFRSFFQFAKLILNFNPVLQFIVILSSKFYHPNKWQTQDRPVHIFFPSESQALTVTPQICFSSHLCSHLTGVSSRPYSLVCLASCHIVYYQTTYWSPDLSYLLFCPYPQGNTTCSWQIHTGYCLSLSSTRFL